MKDGILGIRTQGFRMEGIDKSNELWHDDILIIQ